MQVIVSTIWCELKGRVQAKVVRGYTSTLDHNRPSVVLVWSFVDRGQRFFVVRLGMKKVTNRLHNLVVYIKWLHLFSFFKWCTYVLLEGQGNQKPITLKPLGCFRGFCKTVKEIISWHKPLFCNFLSCQYLLVATEALQKTTNQIYLIIHDASGINSSNITKRKSGPVWVTGVSVLTYLSWTFATRSFIQTAQRWRRSINYWRTQKGLAQAPLMRFGAGHALFRQSWSCSVHLTAMLAPVWLRVVMKCITVRVKLRGLLQT